MNELKKYEGITAGGDKYKLEFHNDGDATMWWLDEGGEEESGVCVPKELLEQIVSEAKKVAVEDTLAHCRVLLDNIKKEDFDKLQKELEQSQPEVEDKLKGKEK